MKKYFTLAFIFLSLVVFSLNAQTLTVSPSPIDLHLNSDETADAASSMYNNTSATKTYRWKLYSEGVSGSWSTTVCDKNNCWAPNTSFAPNDIMLAGGASGLLDLTVNPHDVAGQGIYYILVYDVNDSLNSNATLTVNVVVENITGIDDPVGGGVSVYPIPAKDLLNVNFENVKNVNSVAIYNVVGQKLKSVNVSTGSKVVAIPVSDMKKGVYFLRVYSNNKEAVTKTFTKE